MHFVCNARSGQLSFVRARWLDTDAALASPCSRGWIWFGAMSARAPVLLFAQLVREVPDADFAVQAQLLGGELLLSRRGHPALSPRLQLVSGTTVAKWNGDFAAAVLTSRGVLRVSPDGSVTVLSSSGREQRIAGPPEGFGMRTGCAACSEHSGQGVLLWGGQVDGALASDGFRFDVATARWTKLAGQCPPQMHGALVQAADGSVLLAGGFVRFPDRGGDIAALMRDGIWVSLNTPAADKNAVASQVAFEHAPTGRLLFARVHGLRTGKGTHEGVVYCLESDGSFRPIARFALPNEEPWQAVALAASDKALIAVGQGARGRVVSVFEVDLTPVLSALGRETLDAELKPQLPPLPKRLPEVVALRQVLAKSDVLGCVARQADAVLVATCELGRWVKHERHAVSGADAQAVQRARLEQLLAAGFRLDELTSEELFALLTPPVSTRAAVPERSIVESANGGLQIGGDAPSSFPKERWPSCDACESPMTFLVRFDAAQVALQSHDGVAVFACLECMDPTANAAVLERSSPIDWVRTAKGRPKRIKPRLAAIAPSSASALSHLGGEPQFIQDGEGAACRYCGAEQRFVAQLDSSLNPELPFGDGGRGYLFICPSEHEAAFRFDCH